ncbi:putative serine threonine protein kinase domain protein [Erysiphe necator]|uniref:Putative serine threonine protein kinase domain protein n=1 Tax=Uncinula necator TaxID=52586 RepID=A0A0B1P2Q0_UNCNE|nr:putative serine threonine protein kinase domain protein [Erysiphe necator]
MIFRVKSTYEAMQYPISVAGVGQVIAAGHGDLLLSTCHGKMEKLTGAILTPGQKIRILSTSQIENQGFSIRLPIKFQHKEKIRPDGSPCARFKRVLNKSIYGLKTAPRK